MFRLGLQDPWADIMGTHQLESGWGRDFDEVCFSPASGSFEAFDASISHFEVVFIHLILVQKQLSEPDSYHCIDR